MSEDCVEATVLGKETEYKFEYNPDILVAVPRQENRTGIDIQDANLPFVGVDVWNAYEISTITERGVPFAGFAKIVYPCDSECIVESKSLKLYLNSFNMTRFGKTTQEAKSIVEAKVREDLSKVLQTDVQVTVFESQNGCITGNASWMRLFDNLDVDIRNRFPSLSCKKYEECPELLHLCSSDTEGVSDAVFSSVLRSNCKITGQPDWGTVFISYTSSAFVTRDSLFQYVTSLRGENHFHEEICETIYKRLHDLLDPRSLVVACFYTRRGGIDINPIRASSWLDLAIYGFDHYANHENVSSKLPRQ